MTLPVTEGTCQTQRRLAGDVATRKASADTEEDSSYPREWSEFPRPLGVQKTLAQFGVLQQQGHAGKNAQILLLH
jgi:hypothetical protein